MVALNVGACSWKKPEDSVVLTIWYLYSTGWDRIRRKRQHLISNATSSATKQTRNRHWVCYRRFCSEYGLTPIPCSVNQAADYISFLANNMKLSSIITYYQAVRHFHILFGLKAPALSEPYLRVIINGISNTPAGRTVPKDPFGLRHLMLVYNVICLDLDIHVLLWTALLLMFRSLLRVSHIVQSPHTLLHQDIEFKEWGVVLCVRSAKTLKIGQEPIRLPMVKSDKSLLCPVRWLSYLLSRYPRVSTAPVFTTD